MHISDITVDGNITYYVYGGMRFKIELNCRVPASLPVTAIEFNMNSAPNVSLWQLPVLPVTTELASPGFRILSLLGSIIWTIDTFDALNEGWNGVN